MPGALITPACYDLLIQGIQRAGCHVEIASLAGSNPPNPDESTAAIDSKDLLDRYLVPLIEAGKDVMMFAHFFGATCLSGALDKASTAERTAIGQAGSVIGIVRISTALVPDGQSQVGYLRGGWPPFCKLDYVNIAAHVGIRATC